MRNQSPNSGIEGFPPEAVSEMDFEAWCSSLPYKGKKWGAFQEKRRIASPDLKTLNYPDTANFGA
jgi:hypothetical protein